MFSNYSKSDFYYSLNSFFIHPSPELRPHGLDLFALNVPTGFAFRFTIFGKSTPHSVHRSLPQEARVIKVPFGKFETFLFVGFHPTYQLK